MGAVLKAEAARQVAAEETAVVPLAVAAAVAVRAGMADGVAEARVVAVTEVTAESRVAVRPP